MMNKKHQRYPFPMHPPDLYPFFLGMCTLLTEAEANVLAAKVSERRAALDGEMPTHELSTRLAAASAHLLTLYPSMGQRERKLIVGAVRSYLMHRDSIPDNTPEIGLIDDLAVMNYVMEQVGVENHFIIHDPNKSAF